LHMICTHYLPMQYVESCESMIDTYFPQMIEYVKQKYPPRVICENLKLCNKNQSKVVVEEPANQHVQCAMCSSILRIAKSIAKETRLLQAQQAKQQLGYVEASQVKSLCEYFESEKNQKQCTAVMQQFKHKLILKVAQYKGSMEQMNEFEVCQQVQACQEQQ